MAPNIKMKQSQEKKTILSHKHALGFLNPDSNNEFQKLCVGV